MFIKQLKYALRTGLIEMMEYYIFLFSTKNEYLFCFSKEKAYFRFFNTN